MFAAYALGTMAGALFAPRIRYAPVRLAVLTDGLNGCLAADSSLFKKCCRRMGRHLYCWRWSKLMVYWCYRLQAAPHTKATSRAS